MENSDSLNINSNRKKSSHTPDTSLSDNIAANFVIPDLCKINSVLFLLILTQILSLILCLMISRDAYISWEQLGLLSIYCHAVTLSFAALICTTRRFLFHRNAKTIALYFLGSNILITGLYSWLGSQFLLPGVVTYPELFILKSITISSFLAAIVLRYFFLQHQWREQRQAELRSRIQALQARIRPHFLFNSMNSIASLIGVDPNRAEEAVLDLSTLFRATLNNQATLIPVDDEIGLCKRYLNIEALRLGKRLKTEWHLNHANKKVMIPPLCLQPLVENAIYHGIQPLTEGGTISIRSDIKQNFLYILISNPVKKTEASRHGNQIALDNIRSRLRAIFNTDAILKTSQLDDVFTVTMRIPIQ